MGKGRETWPSHCRDCDMPLNELEGDFCDICYSRLPHADQTADDALLAFLWWVDDVSTPETHLVLEAM